MFNLPKEFVVWDSEWTTWEGSPERWWTAPGEHRELIQLGAVLIETDNFRELGSFNVLIKPKKNPILSHYCLELTGITQSAVDLDGISSREAIQWFYSFCGSHPLYSWSRTDLEVLAENCKICAVILPFESSRFFDIRVLFWKRGIAAEKYNSGTIVEAFGKKPGRRDHDALNDARSIVDGLKELAKRFP